MIATWPSVRLFHHGSEMVPHQNVGLRLDPQHLQQLLQLRLSVGDVQICGPDTHEDPELVRSPLGDHVDDAAQLEHEEAGGVGQVGLLRREEVERPDVQIFLPAGSLPELGLRAEHLLTVEGLKVPTEANVFLELQSVLDNPNIFLWRNPLLDLIL